MSAQRPVSRRYRDAAIRVAAIGGVMMAMPNATDSEISRALGIGRDSVWRYRHGKLKYDPANEPVWRQQLLRACSFLANGQMNCAADNFDQLAKMLREEKRAC